MSLARSVAVVGVAAAGLLLSGCGTSAAFHPGTASVVGDDSVTMSTVDDTATHYCEAYLSQTGQSAPSAIPMRLLRQSVAVGLTQRLLGQQLAAEYSVRPASQYASYMSSQMQGFASAPVAVRNAVYQVQGGSAYLQSVQIAIGQKLDPSLAGQDDKSVKAALQRGQVAAQDYLENHTVELDPSFGVSVDGEDFAPATGGTSFAVSDLATQAQAKSPTPAYTDQLPANQVCG